MWMQAADRTKSINLDLLEEMFQIEEKEKPIPTGGFDSLGRKTWSIHPFLVYWELFLTMYRIIFPQPPLNPRWRRYWIQNEHRILVRDRPRYLNELFVIREVQFSIEYRKLSRIASFLL